MLRYPRLFLEIRYLEKLEDNAVASHLYFTIALAHSQEKAGPQMRAGHSFVYQLSLLTMVGY